MKSPLSFFIFLISFFIFLLSCKRTTEPLSAVDRLQLNVTDVSCTEAWLSLKADNSLLGGTLKLYGNDRLILSHELTSADTLLYADSLRPAKKYAFTAQVYDGDALLAASPKTAATTLDTTSHDFTWQTWEFGGQGGSSSFYDVAIIDENDIWAVGEIYTAEDQYNAAHWDGEKWELRKISYGGWFWKINTVFAFSHNDVWFSAFVKWNGSRFIEYPVPDVLTGYGLNKIWGTSDSNLYIVGNGGLIAHYDGRQWSRIETGTNFDIHDIWGDFNLITNKWEILALSSQMYYGEGLALLQITSNNTVNHLDTTGLRIGEQSVWFKAGKQYYITGDGVFKSRHPYGSKADWNYLNGHPKLWKSNIRGTDVNDIFVVGAYGLVSHYNGSTWKHYSNNELPTFYGEFTSVKLNNNLVILVGYKNESAYILMGQRN